MGKNTKQQIIDRIKNEDVKFIRLQFTDILGALKNVTITASQIEKALDNQCMFDGSSIEGFVRIEESDMYLYPDIDTFELFPWGPQQDKVARLICDVYKHDGTPFEGDPRYVLKKVIEYARSKGYDCKTGPECEFFLFKTDVEGRATTITHDDAGYFDLDPVDLGECARRDICLALEKMGFEVETSHHECAQGQHEIDFKYADALKTADNVATFKLAVKTIAQKHGLYATFMPKPIFGICGSGMHCNLSLSKDGKNAFYDVNDKFNLSKDTYYFIGGLLKHIKAISAITNPLVNSYKRLVPGYEAPCYIAWSGSNRSTLCRIPAARGEGTRVELRSPDPACNPYLSFAVILAAGFDGIINKIEPPASVDKSIYEMTDKERKEENIENLPGSLEEALKYMKEDTLIRETLGEHIFFKYIEAKTQEWSRYKTRVSQWEIAEYLEKY